MKTYSITLRSIVRSLAIALAVTTVSQSAFALKCQEVRTLTSVYFKVHYSFASFDDEISQRTLENFIKMWDPGKVYFLQMDVDNFRKKYATKLDDLIMAGKCSVIDDVVNVYSKRFAQVQPMIKKWVDAKHDFSKEEFLEIDRKKLAYAKSSEEISDRWRKRVKFSLLNMKNTIKDLKKGREKLHKRYQLAAKRHNEMTSSQVYSYFLNAFSSALDPHSEYLSAERLEDFRIQTRLSLEGIGAVLRMEEGFTTIQSLVPGGAAAKTGLLRVDDKIIAVAQGVKGEPVDVIDMDLRDVVKLIRGTRNTIVQLTVVRDEGGKAKQLLVPVTREKIQLTEKQARGEVFALKVDEPSSKKADYKVGVIKLPSFYIDFEGRQRKLKNYRSSSADMRREIAKMKKLGIDALIVDLRTNGGGSLDESISVAGLFFDKGPVVQIKTREGRTFPQNDEDGVTHYDGPLVVMINRQSASASEIFAGAIQDHGRGLIVGDSHTFGKGTVQNLNDLADRLGAIKVTISQFYRPLGGSTQLRGVQSDIVLPNIYDEYEIGEKYYDYAMPWDKIKQAKVTTKNQTTKHLTKLKILSEERIAKDASFKKIAQEIKEYKESDLERSRVSLKEKTEADKKKEKKELAKKEGKDKQKKSEASPHDPSAFPILEDDPHLQESLRIATDFARLLQGKPTGRIEISSLKTQDQLVAEQSEKKPAAATETKPAKP